MKVKEYKCAVCKGRCEGSKEALISRVANCELSRDVRAVGPCGLSQIAEFVIKFDEKMAKRGALLVPDFQKGQMVKASASDMPLDEIEVPDVIRILVNKKGHKDVLGPE